MTTRTVNSRWIATGDPGVRETLQIMQRVVHAAIADPSFVWWARELVNDCPPRQELCCAQTIREYVRRSVWFCRDPLGVENITPPLEHMRKLRGNYGGHVLGDCDDAATLSAALGMAVGLPAQFQALAFGRPDDPPGTVYTDVNAPYMHVYTTLMADGVWHEMDTTRPDQMLPPTIVRRLTMRV